MNGNEAEIDGTGLEAEGKGNGGKLVLSFYMIYQTYYYS